MDDFITLKNQILDKLEGDQKTMYIPCADLDAMASVAARFILERDGK